MLKPKLNAAKPMNPGKQHILKNCYCYHYCYYCSEIATIYIVTSELVYMSLSPLEMRALLLDMEFIPL